MHTHTLYTFWMSEKIASAKIKAFFLLDVYFIIHVYKIKWSNKAKKINILNHHLEVYIYIYFFVYLLYVRLAYIWAGWLLHFWLDDDAKTEVGPGSEDRQEVSPSLWLDETTREGPTATQPKSRIQKRRAAPPLASLLSLYESLAVCIFKSACICFFFFFLNRSAFWQKKKKSDTKSYLVLQKKKKKKSYLEYLQTSSASKRLFCLTYSISTSRRSISNSICLIKQRYLLYKRILLALPQRHRLPRLL